MSRIKYWNGSEWVLAEEYSISVPFEVGGINTTYGNVTDTKSEIGNTWRTAYPVQVDNAKQITIIAETLPASLSVIEYGSDWSVIAITDALNNPKIVKANATKYIKVIATGSNPYSVKIVADGEINTVKNPYIIHGTQGMHFSYEVYDGVYNTGRLLLPNNYSVDGDKIPLIMYSYGATAFTKWNFEFQQPTYTNLSYLVDEGFAVLFVYGFTSKYDVDGKTYHSCSFAMPISIEAYTRGIEYVCDRYNIDNERRYVYSKSLGGSICGLMAENNRAHLKAIAHLAPEIDCINYGSSTGYTTDCRAIIAQEWGINPDDVDSFIADPASVFQSNKENINPWNLMWHFSGQTLAQKFTSRSNYSAFANYWRTAQVPIKLWVAPDDTNISYPACVSYISQLQNNGCEAFIRLMPEGTGAHNAVDTAANALRVASVTTATGVVHENVPLAYVELVEWFNKHK